MYKVVAIFVLAVASVSAAPGALLASYAAPVAPAVVTAHSSQVIARNYNTFAAPLVAAAPFAVAAPLKAAPLAYSAPLHAAPYVAAPAAYADAGYVAPYAAAPAYYF